MNGMHSWLHGKDKHTQCTARRHKWAALRAPQAATVLCELSGYGALRTRRAACV